MKTIHELTKEEFEKLREVGMLKVIYPNAPCCYWQIERRLQCQGCKKTNKNNEELSKWVVANPTEREGFCSIKCFSDWWKRDY